MFIAYHLYDADTNKAFNEIGEFKGITYNFDEEIATITLNDSFEISLSISDVYDYDILYGQILDRLREKCDIVFLHGVCCKNFNNCKPYIDRCFDKVLDEFGKAGLDYAIRDDSLTFTNFFEDSLADSDLYK